MPATLARKPVPKRLEDELKNIPKYNPRTEPQRRTVADILGDSVERAAYDEILGPLVNRSSALSKMGSSSMITASEITSGSKESDFTTSLLARLADAEEEAKSLRMQLIEKNSKITNVERENAQLRAIAEAPTYLMDEVNSLKSENFLLEKQIVDMEEFLHDYGLQWVGGTRNTADSKSTESIKCDDSGSKFSYPAFAAKIEELNSLLSSEPTQIKTDAKRGKIVHASEMFDSMSVTVYSDGIMIRRGPFRNLNSASHASFVRDVMDGFFPSEFREEFPDGVMFHLIDKHSTAFVGSRDQTEGSLSREQFLGKVHKTVLKDGSILSVRQDLANFIDGKSNNESSNFGNGDVVDATRESAAGSKSGNIILKTAASLASRGERKETKGSVDRIIEEEKEVVGSAQRATSSVQVRWLDGTVLLCVLYEGDCVGDIRTEINKYVTSIGTIQSVADYELRSAYPPRALSDLMTLKEAGLTPNGTIHARSTSTQS